MNNRKEWRRWIRSWRVCCLFVCLCCLSSSVAFPFTPFLPLSLSNQELAVVCLCFLFPRPLRSPSPPFSLSLFLTTAESFLSQTPSPATAPTLPSPPPPPSPSSPSPRRRRTPAPTPSTSSTPASPPKARAKSRRRNVVRCLERERDVLRRGEGGNDHTRFHYLICNTTTTTFVCGALLTYLILVYLLTCVPFFTRAEKEGKKKRAENVRGRARVEITFARRGCANPAPNHVNNQPDNICVRCYLSKARRRPGQHVNQSTQQKNTFRDLFSRSVSRHVSMPGPSTASSIRTGGYKTLKPQWFQDGPADLPSTSPKTLN